MAPNPEPTQKNPGGKSDAVTPSADVCPSLGHGRSGESCTPVNVFGLYKVPFRSSSCLWESPLSTLWSSHVSGCEGIDL